MGQPHYFALFVVIVYFGLSQLVPKYSKIEDLKKINMDDEIDYIHAFAGELGWLDLELTDGYYNEEPQGVVGVLQL